MVDYRNVNEFEFEFSIFKVNKFKYEFKFSFFKAEEFEFEFKNLKKNMNVSNLSS